ncbi:MAG: adenosine deaminase [Acidimicrobiia bacterium]|nr:MAG: adenosine deaminase [Acidimicrobiia bacterium]
MVGYTIEALPKVVLHDHLDGGLRASTVLDLAREVGYEGLPARDAGSLEAWFHQAGAASLAQYLEAFRHTFGVMQTPEAMARVAYEAVADLAADGVVYAEMRFAPSLHLSRGMSRSEAIAGVLEGLTRGEAEFGMTARVIVDAMRQDTDSEEVVAAALGFVGRGVVGFDLAGPEAGFPASGHSCALRAAAEGGLHITIHAGEGAGVESIADALACGAERLGHGVRIVEDLDEDGRPGPVAGEVLERRIALEVCPTSNLDTKIYARPKDHPLGRLHRSGFVVTINTDNRLMSATSPSRELAFAVERQGMSLGDLETITMAAIDAAFCDEDTRQQVRLRVADGYRGVEAI